MALFGYGWTAINKVLNDEGYYNSIFGWTIADERKMADLLNVFEEGKTKSMLTPHSSQGGQRVYDMIFHHNDVSARLVLAI